MLQKSRGVSFLRSAKRRRQPHRLTALGDPKTGKKILTIKKNQHKSTKHTRYMLKNSRGVFCLRSAKRRRQPHRRTLLGDPKTGKPKYLESREITKIDKTHKVHTPKFQGPVSSEVAEAPQADTQTHPAGGP